MAPWLMHGLSSLGSHVRRCTATCLEEVRLGNGLLALGDVPLSCQLGELPPAVWALHPVVLRLWPGVEVDVLYVLPSSLGLLDHAVGTHGRPELLALQPPLGLLAPTHRLIGMAGSSSPCRGCGGWCPWFWSLAWVKVLGSFCAGNACGSCIERLAFLAKHLSADLGMLLVSLVVEGAAA